MLQNKNYIDYRKIRFKDNDLKYNQPNLHILEGLKSQKFELYDVCHHCQRVFQSGGLLDHLKKDCLPRKKRILELQNKQSQEQRKLLNMHNIVESISNPEQYSLFEKKYEINMRQIKHKVLSPWTLEIKQEIRNCIIPTRSIIYQSDEI